jgi:RHS repeat-associated protein
VSERHIYSSSRLGTDVTTHEFFTTTYTVSSEANRELGQKHYEISNYLGNVLSVITDQKLPVEVDSLIVSYSAVVVTATDYSPFGVGLYGRSWSGEYRYGFNGKEVDSEGMGGGSSTYDYGFRIYNAQLGKFLSVDPLTKDYPWYTPYQFAGNRPIWAIDLDGLEEFARTDYVNVAGQLYRTTLTMISNLHTDRNRQIVHLSQRTEQPNGSFVDTYQGSNIGSTTGTNAFANPAFDGIVNPANLRMNALNIDASGNRVTQPASDIVRVTTAGPGGGVRLVQAATVELTPSTTESAPGYVWLLRDAAGNNIGFRSEQSISGAGTGGATSVRLDKPLFMRASPVVIDQPGIAIPANDENRPSLHFIPPDARNRIDNSGTTPPGEPIGSNIRTP